MGREVKRVALDFEWPMKKTWRGYLMPVELHSTECKACSGSGQNAMTRVIADAFYDQDGFGNRWTYEYGTALDGSPADRPPWRIKGDCRRWCGDLTQDEIQGLVDKGRLYDLTHDFVPGKGWQPKEPPVIPTPEQVKEWDSRSMGHDAINRWTLIETRAKRYGIWGNCDVCQGEGELWKSDEQKLAHEAWEPSDPPEGDGWQMWETTSEGSPISPVFETPQELARWLADNNASTFGSDTASYGTWLKMITGAGWAMSAVMDGKGFRSGVDAAVDA
jgi:hypothetical protein